MVTYRLPSRTPRRLTTSLLLSRVSSPRLTLLPNQVVSRANYTVLQLDDGTGTLRLLMTVNEDELMYGPATDPVRA